MTSITARKTLFQLAFAGLAAVFLPIVPPITAVHAAETGDGSYGYFRVIEGGATLIPAGGGPAEAAEVNQPVLPGDRVLAAEDGRLEIVLADRNLLRLDGGSEILLQELAGTAEASGSSSRQTRLRVERGNFQLAVVRDALGDELPRIDTPNATFYIQYPGAFRVTTDEGDWSSLVARSGSAEVVTAGGSRRVKAGEEAQVEGTREARVQVGEAGSIDAIERWGHHLEDQVAESRELDEHLRYSGSSLARYGSWIEVDEHRYWRPFAAAGWRPYQRGRWVHTPAGFTWVASEPWGWVPYHYGSWDFLPGYGWVWEPGTVYSPAWVYWYWGPSEIGWCPIGYYTHWYRHAYHDPAFRAGVYGWAGGDWGGFAEWSFVSHGHFGQRNIERFARSANDLRGDMRSGQLPRGLITTDTRGIPRGGGKPQQVYEILTGGPSRAGGRPGAGHDLPDVTSFVARNPKLPPAVLRQVIADGPAQRPLLPVSRPRGDNTGGGREWRERPSAPPRNDRPEGSEGAVRRERPEGADRRDRRDRGDRGDSARPMPPPSPPSAPSAPPAPLPPPARERERERPPERRPENPPERRPDKPPERRPDKPAEKPPEKPHSEHQREKPDKPDKPPA